MRRRAWGRTGLTCVVPPWCRPSAVCRARTCLLPLPPANRRRCPLCKSDRGLGVEAGKVGEPRAAQHPSPWQRTLVLFSPLNTVCIYLLCGVQFHKSIRHFPLIFAFSLISPPGTLVRTFHVTLSVCHCFRHFRCSCSGFINAPSCRLVFSLILSLKLFFSVVFLRCGLSYYWTPSLSPLSPPLASHIPPPRVGCTLAMRLTASVAAPELVAVVLAVGPCAVSHLPLFSLACVLSPSRPCPALTCSHKRHSGAHPFSPVLTLCGSCAPESRLGTFVPSSQDG